MKRARTTEAKEQRRDAILKAALDEFYERGYAAALTDAIAERAGVSKGTLYLYFANKEELFAALIDSLAKPQLERLEMIAKFAPSFEMALNGIAEFAPAFVRDSDMPKLLKVLIGESQIFPDVIHGYRKNIIDRVLALIAGLLNDAKTKGEIGIDDPALTARLVVAPIIFSAMWQAVFAAEDKKPVDLNALFEMHAHFLMKAMSPGRPTKIAPKRKSGDKS